MPVFAFCAGRLKNQRILSQKPHCDKDLMPAQQPGLFPTFPQKSSFPGAGAGGAAVGRWEGTCQELCPFLQPHLKTDVDEVQHGEQSQ